MPVFILRAEKIMLTIIKMHSIFEKDG